MNGVSTFVEVVEAGSFALAAQRLNLTRSAVGKSIARLEERLGARLFHRTTRSQRLTDDGQAYYDACLRALAELEGGEAALDDGRRAPAGRLRIGTPVLFGRRCATPILLALAQRYPELSMEVLYSDQVTNLIEAGIDLAIRGGPLGDSPGLQARGLGMQYMVLCASLAYLAQHPAPQTLADLAAHEGIAYTRSGQKVAWRFYREDGELEEIRMRGRCTLNDLEAIRDAGLAGMGLIWMPRWLIRDELRSGALIPLLDHLPDYGIPMHLVWPHNRHLPSRMRVLIDALAAELPGLLARRPGQ
ncbi:LysR family transcriptional regulator [Andreprevotia lacus]|jgi:DNA-binding transcriptional LysR family regulator|nr:LysR family transcriptional regulator [Andreprevotia lacus]